MTNNDTNACEECGNATIPYIKGKYIIHKCPKCNSDVDMESFMAEHYSEEE